LRQTDKKLDKFARNFIFVLVFEGLSAPFISPINETDAAELINELRSGSLTHPDRHKMLHLIYIFVFKPK